jgi:dihydrofolate synthase/folylpolyglutamate synthase
MSYEGVLEELETKKPSGLIDLGIDKILRASQFLGSPEKSFKSIHIAGTNGKGSTAVFLSSILERSGYKVGLFTSPHLSDIRERVVINQEMILKDDFVKLYRLVEEVDSKNNLQLTYFEVITMIAFLYFSESKVDFAVVETGLGGRLDATNIIEPEVAIITRLAVDHKRWLGETLEAIAKEKAGIIKKGLTSLVTIHQEEDAMKVIEKKCVSNNVSFYVEEPLNNKVALGLAGKHQRENAALALKTARLLKEQGCDISGEVDTLKDVSWPGRLETISGTPYIILDGAHNLSGAAGSKHNCG